MIGRYFNWLNLIRYHIPNDEIAFSVIAGLTNKFEGRYTDKTSTEADL